MRVSEVCNLKFHDINLENGVIGQGKENINVQKLKGAEKTKYEIYHVIKDVLPKVKIWK